MAWYRFDLIQVFLNRIIYFPISLINFRSLNALLHSLKEISRQITLVHRVLLFDKAIFKQCKRLLFLLMYTTLSPLLNLPILKILNLLDSSKLSLSSVICSFPHPFNILVFEPIFINLFELEFANCRLWWESLFECTSPVLVLRSLSRF